MLTVSIYGFSPVPPDLLLILLHNAVLLFDFGYKTSDLVRVESVVVKTLILCIKRVMNIFRHDPMVFLLGRYSNITLEAVCLTIPQSPWIILSVLIRQY